MKVGSRIMKWVVGAMFVVGMYCVSNVASGQGTPGDSLEPLTSISSPEAAIGRAYRLTGIKQLQDGTGSEDISRNAALVKYEDSTFPFLADQVSGKACWRVSLDSFYMRRQRGPLNGLPAEKPKHVDLFIDSASGEFVKGILTCYDKADKGLRPEVSATLAESRMAGERYLGLVEKAVPTTLTQAIDVAVGPASTAHEIIVYLVEYSDMSLPPHPYWMVIVRGVIPFPVLGAPPGWQDPNANRMVGRIRSGVDAITGEIKFVRAGRP